MAQKLKTPVTEITVMDIESEMITFLKDARKITNKTAATRARMTSLRIEKTLKAYRYNSIK